MADFKRLDTAIDGANASADAYIAAVGVAVDQSAVQAQVDAEAARVEALGAKLDAAKSALPVV